MAAFDIDRIVEDALEYYPRAMSVNVFDASSGSDVPIYSYVVDSGDGVGHAKPAAVASPQQSGEHFPGLVTVADRVWTIDCAPSAENLAQHRSYRAAVILLAGLAGTVFLVGGLIALTDRTLRVEQRVAGGPANCARANNVFAAWWRTPATRSFSATNNGESSTSTSARATCLGYSREELLTMAIDDIDPTFVERNLARYSALPDEDYPVTFEGVHRRKDGTTFPVELRLAPLYIGGTRFMLSLARDITDRKRAEQVLQKERRLLRDLLDLHERDRQLMAYEIHDGLAQLLTGALYKFQSIAHSQSKDPAAAAAAFDEAVQLLARGIAETRRLISGLRPPILDESGIVAAVEFLICEQSRPQGPRIEFEHEVQFDRLAAPLESSVFRIIQESLTNACRYSQSERVLVRLRQVEDRVQICVQDWGIGFDPATVCGDHFGLRGIRERARLLGGKATIESAPSQGTRISVELPIVPQPVNGIADGDKLP